MMKKSRKALNFDLSEEKLRLYYPKKDIKQAWNDIEKFMSKEGFEHRQKSGYASERDLFDAEEVKFLIDGSSFRTYNIAKAKRRDVKCRKRMNLLLNIT